MLLRIMTLRVIDVHHSAVLDGLAPVISVQTPRLLICVSVFVKADGTSGVVAAVDFASTVLR